MWGNTGNDVQATVKPVYIEQIKAFTTDIVQLDACSTFSYIPPRTLRDRGSVHAHTCFNDEHTYITLLLQFHFAFGEMQQVFHFSPKD